MNYLAHLYLSGPSDGVRLGNFIGDYVKGNRFSLYPPEIRKGILLHRQIDSFMDEHPLSHASAELFRARYTRFSRVIIDVVYDHYLAKNWDKYSDQSLHDFVNEVHKLFITNYFILPPQVRQFLPFLIRSRRMENYQHLSGIEKTLKIMANHTVLPDHSAWAVEQIVKNDRQLQEQFTGFFEDIREMCRLFLENYKGD
ncbi:ACP phosphodiesterase [Xiashengella succiniciproducens]|jgi:acyl carrier protein phosphodiesterase|uniref:ACP phosphodiesterase n=1 Tax=Xiashengella succiniciproducens TaxID=2949635 RepID=A0A9J6ZR51_9BACT|nr:ACP phosphodiesterase [Alkaliflexus sp. Ai-910]MDI9538807.1 ACP phosphodiesterase [Bacteroidota bacterium]URW80075.1 ACP phosphodiesterase [Alkaliflexus sp. Ai-910]